MHTIVAKGCAGRPVLCNVEVDENRGNFAGLLIFLSIVGCADHPDKWRALDFEKLYPNTSEAPPQKTQEGEAPVSPSAQKAEIKAEGELSIHRGQLNFRKREIKIEHGKMIISGTLSKGEEADREVILEGAISGETGIVELHDTKENQDDSQKTGAMMYCLGQGPGGHYSCDDFYMNLYVSEPKLNKVYTDQFRPTAEPAKPEVQQKNPQPAKPNAPKLPSLILPQAPSYEQEQNYFDQPVVRDRGFPVTEMDVKREIGKLKLTLPKFDEVATTTTSSTSTTSTTTSTTTTSTTPTTLPKAPVQPIVPAKPTPIPVKPRPPQIQLPTPIVTTTTTSTTTSTTVPVPAQVLPPVQTEDDKQGKNQAIGSHTHGWLKNPTDLLQATKKGGLNVNFLWPAKNEYFGTMDMAFFLKKLGEDLKEILPGAVLNVGAVSDKDGGSLNGHGSHQTGLDIDISYLVRDSRLVFKDITKGNGLNDDFLIAENWELLKKAFATNMVDGIFVDARVQKALCFQALAIGDIKDDPEDHGPAYDILRRISIEPSHYHHFHVRLKCSENQKPRCFEADPGFETLSCLTKAKTDAKNN